MFTKTDISDGNNFPILCVSTLNILFQKFGDIYQYNKLNNSINLLKLNVESNKCGYRIILGTKIHGICSNLKKDWKVLKYNLLAKFFD